MSNIKINDVPQRIQYSSTGGQTQFTIPFPFFANSYVYVWLNGIQLLQGGAPGQYTVTGAGSPSGGLVTFNTAATLNDIVTIEGIMPIDRTSIYSATISNLTGSDLNGDFNREVVMMQQINTVQQFLQLQYAPWALVSQDPTVTRDRYLPILAAEQVWRMNEAGTAIEAITINTSDIPAPIDGAYWVSESNSVLTNEVDLGLLTTGLLKHTVTAGVSVPSTAVQSVDYWAPGDELTRLQAPVFGDDVTNKSYVDSVAAGFTFVNPVNVASTGAFSATYNNGTAGVGATLTANSNGAASIDGVSLSLGDRVLFKNQSNTFENGIYEVSQVGDGSTPAIYIRTSDFDTPAEIEPGDLIPILEGTVNGLTFWIQTATVTTIGTDAIIFVQFGAAYSNVVTIDGTQTVTGDKTFTGLTTLDSFIFDSNQMQHESDLNNYFEFGTDTQNFVTGGSSRMDLSNLGLRLGGANSRVEKILDEDNMASNSDTALATQQSIKAYVDSQLSGSVTSWVAYTPTFTSFGTPSNVQIWSRRVGDTLCIRGRFTGGSGSGSEGRMTLGFNGTNANITSSNTKIMTIQMAGAATVSYSAAASITVLIEANVGYITFGVQGAGNNGLTKVNGSALLASGDSIGFTCEIPVNTWP